MALDTTMLEADLAFMVADLPATLTVSGRSYSCTASEVRNAPRTDDQGMIDVFDAEVHVQQSLFSGATPPKENQVVRLGNRSYRIQMLTESADGISYILGLMAAK